MKKTTLFIASLLAISSLSCQNKTSTETTEATKNPTEITQPLPTHQCFLHALNKDSVKVNLTVLADSVRGTLDYLRYEKDSARGRFKGVKDADGNYKIRYEYMIEGQNQTEEKVMKLADGKLYFKVGELLDPNNDGNLVYKDVTKATFSEVLEPTDCPNN